MKQFSEATRVQMPAMVHLTRIGYTYFGKLSEDKNGTVYDGDTNILLPVFEHCVSSRCSLLDSRIWLYTKKGWIVRLNILPPIVNFDCKYCLLKDCLKKQVQQK